MVRPLRLEGKRGLISLHFYIIDQEQLCCTLQHCFERWTPNNESDSKVVKAVNYTRSHALEHRQFRKFVEEEEAKYQDLSSHAEVHWLSTRTALERFMDLLPVIQEFTAQTKQADLCHVSDDKSALVVAFLADITEHLNVLNLKLQGNGWSAAACVREWRFSLQRKVLPLSTPAWGIWSHTLPNLTLTSRCELLMSSNQLLLAVPRTRLSTRGDGGCPLTVEQPPG